MTIIFHRLLQMSFHASIIISIILFVRLLFQKLHIPKKYVCVLWAFPMLRMIFPISIESRFSIMPEENITNYISQPTFIPVSRQTVPLDTNTIQQLTESTATASPAMKETVTHADSLLSIQTFPEIIWGIGIIILFIYSLVSLMRIRHNLQSSVLVKNSYGNTELFESDYIDSPFVFGFFKPKIYLPSSISTANYKYIIAHEQAHIQRKDHILKVLAFIITSIHWFNPFAWIMYIYYGKDIEMACDESVIQQLGEDKRIDYAQTLLNLTIENKRMLGIPLAFGEGETKARIKHIINHKSTKNILIAVAGFIILIIGVTTLTDSDTTYSANQKKQLAAAYLKDVFDISNEKLNAYENLFTNENKINEWKESYVEYFDADGYKEIKATDELLSGVIAKLQGYELQDIKITEEHHGERCSWCEYEVTLTTATMQQLHRGTIIFSKTESNKIGNLIATSIEESPRGEIKTLYHTETIDVQMSSYGSTSRLSANSILKGISLSEAGMQNLLQLEHIQNETITLSDGSKHGVSFDDSYVNYAQTAIYSTIAEIETFLDLPLLESSSIHYPDSGKNLYLTYIDAVNDLRISFASSTLDDVLITPAILIVPDSTHEQYTVYFEMEGQVLHENYITANGKNAYLFLEQSSQTGELILVDNGIRYNWSFSSSDNHLDLNWMRAFTDTIE